MNGAASPSRWRASPRRFGRLVFGLWMFGTGEGLVVHSDLGNSPWTVLSEGVSLHTPLSIGIATIAISAAVLLLWIGLRQRPGLGTVMNAILIGLAIDVTLALTSEHPGIVERWFALVGGVALVAIGSGIYLGTALGPGPRDGLMTGLHRVTGVAVARVRVAIELSALAAGRHLPRPECYSGRAAG